MSPAQGHEGGGGRYTLFDEIASGGMASVHIGRLVSTAGFARTVAIKRLYPQYAKDPEFVTMFLDEARLAARIKHPNVVPTLDIVQGEGQLLLVMEYVHGETLARLSRAVRGASQAFDPRVACAVLVGVLHGLHAAHEAKNEFGEPLGLVHRDVSPQNVLVGTDGVARVVDFGVAKAIGQAHETRGKEIRGKIRYMSPEQVRGGTVTRSTDVWAAGVVLWETLAGKRLFEGDNDALVMKKVVSAEVPALASVSPDVPPALEPIVRKALCRAPADRYATARAMALAIEQAVPLALPSEVGEYVERACAETLAKRSGQVHEIESSSRAAAAGGIVASKEFIADALWSNLPKTATAAPALPLTPLAVAPNLLAPPPSPGLARAPGPALALAPAAGTAPGAAQPVAPAPWTRPATRPPPAPPRKPSALRWAIPLGTLVVLGVAAFAAGPLVVPGYAKEQAIQAAANRGISLTIDSASGGYGGVEFRGLAVSIPELAGFGAKIERVQVDLASLRPVLARVDGVKVSLDGPVAKTLDAVAVWYRRHRGGQDESPADGMRVDVGNGEVAWTHAMDEEGRIEIADITGELAPRVSGKLGDELHFTSARVALATKSGKIGPWRVDVEQDPNATTARIAFDPPVPDGPNAIVQRMTTGKTLIDVNVLRTPLSRVGVSKEWALAWGAGKQAPDQVELKLHYVKTSDERVDATLALGIFGVRVPPMPAPTEVHVTGTLGGDARSPIEVTGGSLSVGPVKAALSGPVVLRADGVSATLAWRAAPIPCSQVLPDSGKAASDLAQQLADLAKKPGDLSSLGVDVTALAQAAGLARISGTLQASGTVGFDTADPGATSFTVTGKNTCGIGLFPVR